MNKLFLSICFVSACTVYEKEKQKPFPALTISGNDEWATYEGKWLTKGGVIRFELSLKSGSFGYDSYYKLRESFVADSSASGAPSQGLYSSYYGFPNNEYRICLHDVNTYDKGGYLRYDGKDEMFFMTRGNDELLPCDNNFNPLTLDRRYTLHRRSNIFTVEGYFTMEQDSIEFFERNTGEYWKITDLGEFNELTVGYKKLAKEKYEDIYLKALAYSVRDTTSMIGKDALVVKRIISLGNDPD
jgi:hypothetical protein